MVKKLGFFEERKEEILIKLESEILSSERYLTKLVKSYNSNTKEFPFLKERIDKKEMKLIQLKELHRKIKNIKEEI